MKALSIKPYPAMMIMQGEKTIEVRSWYTKYRGDFLICASANPKTKGCIRGHALCIAHLDDVVPFERKHIKPACLDGMPGGKYYAWLLSNVRLVKPFKVKGKLNFYDVDDNLINFICGDGIGDGLSAEEIDKEIDKYITPLID